MVESLHEERLLLKRIAEDDKQSFKILFERYKKKFYAVALKMTPSQDVAEEIVQEAFVAIWTRRASLSHVEKPSGYLFTILYNKVNKHLKKVAEEEQMKAEYLKEVKERQFLREEKNYHSEVFQIIHQLVHQLPKRQKQVYVLSKEEGLSREEIAQYLELSPHTVKNHLQKAMEFMRSNAYKGLVLLLISFFI